MTTDGANMEGSGPVQVWTLTDGANRFLHALRDLGLLDGQIEAELLDRVMRLAEGPVGFQDVRRVLAEMAFERNSPQGESGLLDFLGEEWRLIFH